MAHFTIDAYFEALLYYPQRHERLVDMYPYDPLARRGYKIGHDTIAFKLFDGKRPWSLTLPTDYYFPVTAQTIKIRIAEIADCSLFAEAQYLEEAITVFDNNGEPHIRRALLQADYTALPDFIRQNCAPKYRNNLRIALQNIALASRTLQRKRIRHGALSFHTLTFDDKAQLHITDYPLSTKRSNDHARLAEAALLLFVAACDIEAYKILLNRSTSQEEYQQRLRHIISAAEHHGIVTLANIAKHLATTVNSNTYSEAIEALACENFRPIPLLFSLLTTRYDPARHNTPNVIPYDGEEYCADEVVDFNECDEVFYSDNFVRYRKGSFWGYAHWDGKCITVERLLTHAGDFEEGRAVIRTARGYGMIDTTGHVVMNDVWKDLHWYADENIALAANDKDQWYIFDRMGRRLSTIPADWLGDPAEGFVVARSGKKFGYYSTNGDRLTDCIYDEAYGFSQGTALVTKGSSRYHIDTSLHRISTRDEEIVRKRELEK